MANFWTLLQDSVCPVLQVVSSVPSCKLIEETCERKFSMHFDYCTTACFDFVMLEEATFGNILQVSSSLLKGVSSFLKGSLIENTLQNIKSNLLRLEHLT